MEIIRFPSAEMHPYRYACRISAFGSSSGKYPQVIGAAATAAGAAATGAGTAAGAGTTTGIGYDPGSVVLVCRHTREKREK